MMSKNEILISVIIPIYNVEKHLERCIESVIKQTYKNLEIILVNDGSTDNCGEISNRYSQIDSRIRVIHKANGGLSDARNFGLNIATGKYVTFIDSDDYVHHSLVEVLCWLAQNNDADIAIADYRPVYEDEFPDLYTTMPAVNIRSKVLETEDALEAMLYQKDTSNSACVKLYDRKLFEGDIRYPKGKLCEDLGTTYKLISKAKLVVVCQEKLYFYLQRKNSIIHSGFKNQRMDGLNFAIDQEKFINKNFPQIGKAARNRLFAEAIFIALAISKKGIKLHKKYWQVCKEFIRRYGLEIIRDDKSKAVFRIYAITALISPRLIYPVADILGRIKTHQKRSPYANKKFN